MIVSRASAQGFLGKKLKGLGGGKRSYYVLSEDGSRSFGGPYTKAQAKKRLGQVEYFKHNPKRMKLYIHPNESARKVARRALDRRKNLPKSKRGGLDAIQAHDQGIGSGVMRARDIASGKRINAYQVKAFFDRHRGNYVSARADKKRWEDSKAWQSWDLWGGEPLRKQVFAAVKKDKRNRAISNPTSRPDKPLNSATMSRKSMSKTTTRARKEKLYTVYLVQDRPRGLVLYSFCSKDLISPSASASEYAWLLGESALEEAGTHIFTSDTKLKRFLAKRPGRIIRGRPRYPNPRNSKVKDALAAEATRYKDFNEFSSAYWNSCSRGLYWIATNEKRFHIGLEERKRIKSGTFFVACSPTLALAGKNEGKKFVAEIDVTRLPKGAVVAKRGSGGSEIKIVDSAGAVKVTRVLESVKAKHSFKWQLSILPSSKDELRAIWEKAWDKRRKDAEKKRIRKEKMLERELKRAEARTKEEAQAVDRAAKKLERKTAAAKRERERKSRKARSTKQRVKRVAETRKATAATASSVRKATSKKKSPKKKATSKKKSSKKKATSKKKSSKKKATSKKKSSKKKVSKKAPKGTKWVRMKNPSKGTRQVRSHVNNPGKPASTSKGVKWNEVDDGFYAEVWLNGYRDDGKASFFTWSISRYDEGWMLVEEKDASITREKWFPSLSKAKASALSRRGLGK